MLAAQFCWFQNVGKQHNRTIATKHKKLKLLVYLEASYMHRVKSQSLLYWIRTLMIATFY